MTIALQPLAASDVRYTKQGASAIYKNNTLQKISLVLIAVLFGGNYGGFQLHAEDVKAPVKLRNFDEHIDYKQTLLSGTLSPDKIHYYSITIAAGMTEGSLISKLGPDYEEIESWESRTVNSQLHYLNSLQQNYRDSMHYYILADYFYEKKLEGMFRVVEWNIKGVGKLRIYIWKKDNSSVAHAWLVDLVFSGLDGAKVSFQDKPGLSLVRIGEQRIVWDVDKNTVQIGARE